MFGNLITNRQLKRLRREGCLSISPFNEAQLKHTHYTLNPGRVLKRQEDGDWDIVHSFSSSAKKAQYPLEPNEYVLVEVIQRIVIDSDGIVGRFVTASSNIESGLLVVAGQIDSYYGVNGEAVRFGVKNLLPVTNYLDHDSRLAHVEFFDVRGITPDLAPKSQEEELIWRRRVRDPKWEKADSDGVTYDSNDRREPL